MSDDVIPSTPTDDFGEILEEQKTNVYRTLYRENNRRIIKHLLKTRDNKKNTLATIAKELDTKPTNIQHNLEDLVSNNFVIKGTNQITTYGKEIYQTFELFLEFMIKNKEYFESHDFGDLPLHFKTSVGSFKNCSCIDGKDKCIKVQRKEKEIIKNSKKYTYNLLSAGRYDIDLINTLIDKAEKIKFFEIWTILRRDAIAPPPEIQKVLDEKLKPAIKKNKGKLNGPKRLKTVSVAIVMNEKEAMVMFSNTEKDEPDMCEAFYGDGKEFHQWCLDYFRHCWKKATVS